MDGQDLLLKLPFEGQGSMSFLGEAQATGAERWQEWSTDPDLVPYHLPFPWDVEQRNTNVNDGTCSCEDKSRKAVEESKEMPSCVYVC